MQISSRLRYKHLAFGVGLALGSLLACTTATAASGVAAAQSPIGGRVMGGAGSIVQRGANTIVNQQSKLLALDWQSFNVGKDASVLFKQPGKSAIALNRILDQNPSQIFGKIASNGQIFLINTHGIIFGSSAQLNVGGLVASTLDLTPQDFLKTHFDLDAHGGHAGVVNHGTIAAASGGSVSLIGGHVENDGVIVADYGHINLDGADKAVLDFDGNGLINVEITGALQKRLDADEQAVANKGTLQAAGGTVVLQASAAKNLFTNLVNNSGVIKAGGISTAGGVVRLVGSGGNTVNSGTIDVSGTRGGSVQLLSDRDVMVTDHARIDASGTQGGGKIRVGGGIHGSEGLLQAQRTFVAPDALLRADAGQAGNGGSIAVWSTGNTVSMGSLSARGGDESGAGGFIETSGLRDLTITRSPDVSAAHGPGGNWLVDPNNLVIVSGNGNTNVNASSPFETTDDGASLGTGLITTALQNGDVTISTASGGANTEAGDITVQSGFSFDGTGGGTTQTAGTLTMTAAHDISFTNGSIFAGSGSYKLSVDLEAGHGISFDTGTGITANGGDVTLHASGAGVKLGAIDANNLTVNAAGPITQTADGLTVAGLSSFAASANAITLGNSVNDLAGAVSINNSSASDVTLDNGSNALTLGDVSVGSGALTISAKGIQQTAGSAIKQTASAGTATFNAGAGVLGLGNTGNDFTGAVSLNNSGTDNVTLDNGGNALTLGSMDVGSGTLDVTDYGTGALTLTGNITTAGSAITFANAVTVDATAITIDTTGGGTTSAGITFDKTIDGTTTGSNALTLKAGTTGTVTFGGAVGGGTGGALKSLTTTAHSILLNGGAVTTTNAQAYNGPLVVNNDATLTTTNSAVVFNGTVDSSGSAGKSLTVKQGSGAVTFDDAVGTASGGALGALKVTGTGTTTFGGIVQASSVATSSGTNTLGGDVTTSGAQTYNGAVLLNGSGNSVTLTTTGGNVTFTGAVDNKTSATPEALTVAAGTGDVAFGDAVGGTNGALAGLDITGSGTTTLKGDVTTNGDQTYTGAVLLDDSAGDNSLTLSGTNINFGSSLDGAASLATNQALTVDVGAAGAASFTGAVGGTNRLGALTLDAGGYAVFSSTVDADSLTAKLDTRLHGDVTTHGVQDYEKTLDVFSSALTLTSNDHDITFNDVSNQTTATTLTVDAGSGAAAFNGAVCASGCTSALGLDVTATGGITEGTSGAIKASASSFDAGTGDITLTNTSNDFSGAVTLNGGATQVTTAGALALGKVNAESLVAKAGGAITQSAVVADAVTVSGTSSFTTSGYTIDLSNTSNNFGGAVGLANSGPNAVALDNGSHALTLGDISVGSGALTVTGAGISQATGSKITQTSGAAAATFNAGTSNALALGNTGNDFTGAVAATGAGISIEDTNDLDIASVSEPINHDLSLIAGGTLTMPTGAFDTGTGAITLESGTGGLSAPALTGGDITVSANGGVLTTDNVSGADIALTGKDGITLNGNVTASGTLGLASTDAAITQQSGTITTCATSCTITVNSGTGASAGTIDLTDIGNVFGSPVNLTGGTTNIATSGPMVLGTLATGALTITSTGALSLGTGTVGGALQATSNNGDITQNTASGDSLTVNGAATLDAGTGSIVLANGGNDFKDLVYAFGTGVSIQDANDLEIGGLTNNNGDVSLVAGGNLTGVGSIDAGTGNITLAANGGALTTGALSGNNVSLTGADGITLGDTVTANGGTLTLNSGTTISQDAGAVITADTLTGTSTGATTLDQANTITTLGAFTADGFSLTNGSALTVANGATVDGETGGTSLTVNTGNLTIDGTVGNTGGTTSLTASNGAINEATGGIVAATTLTGLSNGDTVLVGANRIATLGDFKADDFTLVNHAALNVTGPLVTTGNINLTTTGTGNVLSVGQALTGGMITLASAGDLSVEQGIQASTINLTANGNLAIDALVDSGSGATTLTQNGSAGAITEGAHGVITADTLAGAAQGGVVLDKGNAVANLGDFTAVNGLKLTNGQKLTVTAGSTVDGGTSVSLETTGAGSDLQIDGAVKGTAVDLGSSGGVSEGNAGTVTAGVLTGHVAHAANLTGDNAIAGLGDFTANALTLNSAGPLTVVAGATADGGANTTLTTTGATGNLVINGTLKGATTTLKVGGATSEGANGVVSAGTLTGSSVGGTNLTGNNDVANLGDFSADGFALTTASKLTVTDGSTIAGRSGVALTTTGSGNDIDINGTVTGIVAMLTSSGAISQGANGLVQAGELGGSSAGDTKLGNTEITTLDAFNARNFQLSDAHALSLGGPLTTTGNAGDISLTTTGSGNALTVNQALQGGTIKLASASDLTIANAVTGNNVALTSNGNLAINAAVSSGSGTTTLTQAGNGAITTGTNGSITAATLTGSASGATALGSASQFVGNHIGVLGGFSSPAGFSLTNDGTLTLASVAGSTFTVDAGKSSLYLAVKNGDLLQQGTNWLYDGTGTWYASGHIGLATAPIYVTGVDQQAVKFIGLPPAYFYAIDYSGNLLPLTGGSSVNVPTSVLSSRSQGINGHTDHYIDISVITANYRGYGVVPPGLLLPPDQWDCAPDQPSPELCPKGN